jgi:predicted Zn finger-like uncharacterized protein
MLAVTTRRFSVNCVVRVEIPALCWLAGRGHMNVACGACPAKYVIPDEKVRGRKVRIPCKRCGAAIVIDGTAVSTNGGTAAPPLSSGQARSHPASTGKGARETTAARAPKSPESSIDRSLSTPTSTGQAARPPRAMRQTIIGVAAPANAPESPPERPVTLRRPTPVYVRAASTDAQSGPLQGERSPAQTAGKIRSLRRTILGGLDADEPADQRSVPPATTDTGQVPLANSPTPVARKRDIKQTIIGGLEAAAGSAPGAAEPVKRLGSIQGTPLGTWIATLSNGRTIEIPESDLPRAMSSGDVTAETLFWRSGMHGWLPLGQVPELAPLVRASTAGHKAASPQPKPMPRTLPSRPAPVPSFSRPPTGARAPSHAVLTTKRASDNPPITKLTSPPQAGPEPCATAASKAGHRPASLAARSSSPTLELVELDSNDDISLFVSHSDRARPNSSEMQDLERLAAATGATSGQNRSNSVSREPGQGLTSKTSESSSASVGGLPIGDSPSTPQAIEGPQQSVPSVDRWSPHKDSMRGGALPAQSKSKRSVTWLLILLLALACLLASFVARQPRTVYAYLHRRGWDRSVDRIVRRPIDPAIAQLRKWLGR